MKERSKESRKRERVERYKEIAYIMPLRKSFKGLYINILSAREEGLHKKGFKGGSKKPVNTFLNFF